MKLRPLTHMSYGPMFSYTPFQRRYLAIIFILMAILALAASWKFAAGSMQFVTAGVRTKATVTKMAVRADEPDVQYPLLTYRDETGKEHTVPRSSNNYPARAKVGAAFPIRYLKARPEECRFDNFRTLWRTASKGVFISLFNLVVGGVLLLPKRTPKQV